MTQTFVQNKMYTEMTKVTKIHRNTHPCQNEWKILLMTTIPLNRKKYVKWSRPQFEEQRGRMECKACLSVRVFIFIYFFKSSARSDDDPWTSTQLDISLYLWLVWPCKPAHWIFNGGHKSFFYDPCQVWKAEERNKLSGEKETFKYLYLVTCEQQQQKKFISLKLIRAHADICVCEFLLWVDLISDKCLSLCMSLFMGSCSALWQIYERMPAEITQIIHTRDQDRTHYHIYIFPMYCLFSLCPWQIAITVQTPKTAYLKGTPVLNMPQNQRSTTALSLTFTQAGRVPSMKKIWS